MNFVIVVLFVACAFACMFSCLLLAGGFILPNGHNFGVFVGLLCTYIGTWFNCLLACCYVVFRLVFVLICCMKRLSLS